MELSNSELHGRVIVVSGAARGVGREYVTEWNLMHGLGAEERWTRSGLTALPR